MKGMEEAEQNGKSGTLAPEAQDTLFIVGGTAFAASLSTSQSRSGRQLVL